MPRPKYAHKTKEVYTVVPFKDAQEAWFWFVRCQKLRRAGAMKMEGGDSTRPCESDDIYRALIRLSAQRKIGKEHILVLGRFGLREQPPDPRCPEQNREARIWSEALDRQTTALKSKAIIQ
jgi:hypothetical protein